MIGDTSAQMAGILFPSTLPTKQGVSPLIHIPLHCVGRQYGVTNKTVCELFSISIMSEKCGKVPLLLRANRSKSHVLFNSVPLSQNSTHIRTVTIYVPSLSTYGKIISS